jgi:hypothetical protein
MKHPMKGNNMNTTILPLTGTNRAALDEWCATIRTMHATHGRQVTDGDPRLDELRRMGAYSLTMTDEERGELYWARADLELPAWPLTAPAWAERVEVNRQEYPEISVRYNGADRGQGRTTVRAEQWLVVFADRYRDERDGEEKDAGTVLTAAPTVFLDVADDVAPADAIRLGEAIATAGRDLAA